jgi:hypothetical protein
MLGHRLSCGHLLCPPSPTSETCFLSMELSPLLSFGLVSVQPFMSVWRMFSLGLYNPFP